MPPVIQVAAGMYISQIRYFNTWLNIVLITLFTALSPAKVCKKEKIPTVNPVAAGM